MNGSRTGIGNSLSDLLVFGYLSGKNASEFARNVGEFSEIDKDQVSDIIRNATQILNRESGSNPYLLHEALESNMQQYVGIIRSRDDLELGIKHLEKIKEDYKNVRAKGASQFNPGWHEALAMRNLLITAEAVARAALLREESRGAHTRADFPGEQKEWIKYNIVTTKGENGNMQLSKAERPAPDAELERIAASSIEALEEEIREERKQIQT